MLTKRLDNQSTWFRLADPAWQDPLDGSYSATEGGRWNPPNSYAVLYLNEDVNTARVNLTLFAADQPYEPEDLLEEAAPILVPVSLPADQTVADLTSAEGLVAVGLAASYPKGSDGLLIDHQRCHPIGQAAHDSGLDGLHVRCARSSNSEHHELAWFPSPAQRQRTAAAQAGRPIPFSDWYLSG